VDSARYDGVWLYVELAAGQIGPHHNLTYDVVVSCVGEMNVLAGSFIITITSHTKYIWSLTPDVSNETHVNELGMIFVVSYGQLLAASYLFSSGYTFASLAIIYNWTSRPVTNALWGW
jgi:hypothetical protein